MPRLSERLHAVARLVGEGLVLADVGTDHAYVPIYLCQQKRIPRAIAMDIRMGPLERAREHILQYGLQAYIETRLSDGVAELRPGEVDSIVIAGMGGGLTIRILSDGQKVCHRTKELILQPQSDVCHVRSYLAENGYAVEAEEMVAEDGKFYPMMRVHWAEATAAAAASMEGTVDADSALRRDVEMLYGKGLLAARHPVLGTYLEREERNLNKIKTELAAQPQVGQVAKRMREVSYRLECNEAARAYYR